MASAFRWMLILGMVFAGVSCHGTQLQGRARMVSKTIETARENGAYRCAPKELATAMAHYEFSRDELSQGKYHEAQRLLDIADRNARLAVEKSPPEKCAKRLVVDIQKPKPVKLQVKILDRDGDGIRDDNDLCPDTPGEEQWHGCPNPDRDGDGICDPWVTELSLQERFAHVCKGLDQCPNEPEDFDGFEDDDGCPDPDNDKDGVCDPWVEEKGQLDKYAETCKGSDACPDTPGKPEWFGCPDPDRDRDKVCDPWVSQQGLSEKFSELCTGLDKCPDEPGVVDNDGCPVKLKLVRVTVKKIELMQKVFFDYNKATIRKESFELLNEVAQVLKSRPTMTIRIEGHTDDRGGARYNMQLSRERARSVRNFLIKAGIDPSRMTAEGFGLTQPLVPNTSNANRDQNRRVEFVITNQ